MFFSPIGQRTPMQWVLVAALCCASFAAHSNAAAQRRGIGEACSVDDGRTGTCRWTTSCGGPRESIRGSCPGPVNVQCCVANANEAPPPVTSPAPPPRTPPATPQAAPPVTPQAAPPVEEEPEEFEDAVDESMDSPRDPDRFAGLPPLEAAEAAYRDIDFVAAVEFANAAIESGSLSPRELVRTYEILGTGNAALGDDEGARESFTRMLVMDPNREVRDLSPTLRAPYLEARGRVAAMPRAFDIELGISRPTNSVTVRLSDPIGLATSVTVRTRVGGRGDFVEQRFDAAPMIRQELDGISDSGWAETAVEVQDRHGNRVRVLGTTDEPVTLGEPLIIVEGRPAWKSPWLWTALGLVVVGGAGVGLYYGLRPQPYDAQLGLCFSCN